jgi:hypothetical protein
VNADEAKTDIVVTAAEPVDEPGSATAETLGSEAAPIFVDATGRRGRRVRWLAYGLGAVALTYTALVGVSLAGGPVSPEALLPFPDLVKPAAKETPAKKADDPVQTYFRRTGTFGGDPTVGEATPSTAPTPGPVRPGAAAPAPAPAPTPGATGAPTPRPTEGTPAPVDPTPTGAPTDPDPTPTGGASPQPQPQPQPGGGGGGGGGSGGGGSGGGDGDVVAAPQPEPQPEPQPDPQPEPDPPASGGGDVVAAPPATDPAPPADTAPAPSETNAEVATPTEAA